MQHHKDHIEAFQEYHKHMESFKFLFFCRDCMMNFKTKIRVNMCTRCGNSNVIELPAVVIRKERKSIAEIMIHLRDEARLFISPVLSSIAKARDAIKKKMAEKSSIQATVIKNQAEELPTY